MFVFIFEEPP